MDASEIVRAVGMNPDPAAYYGRGATTADLTAVVLERIRGLISRDIGTLAADQFVSMVAELPVLSAEAFLSNLYELELRQWRWHRTALCSDMEIMRGTSAQRPLGIGVQQRDETTYIRTEFLKRQRSSNKEPDYDPFSW